MTEEQKQEELNLDNKKEENAETPIEDKVQNQEGGEDEGQEQKEKDELIEKMKNEALNLASKEIDLFEGPYEKLIDRKFIADPNYKDTKILPTENFNSEIIPKRQFYYKF